MCPHITFPEKKKSTLGFELLETPHQKKVPTKAQPKIQVKKNPTSLGVPAQLVSITFSIHRNNKNASKLSPTLSPLQKGRD
jgi:hypothetical protein